jgi:hypothetical protein
LTTHHGAERKGERKRERERRGGRERARWSAAALRAVSQLSARKGGSATGGRLTGGSGKGTTNSNTRNRRCQHECRQQRDVELESKSGGNLK